MKHFTKTLFTALLLLLGVSVSAHDFEVDGIYYNVIDSVNNTVEVTYQGEKWDSYDEYSGQVVIPETVSCNGITYKVTEIGAYAFCRSQNLTNVTVPLGVTTVNEYAFFRCDGLKSVDLPSSVTTIQEFSFYCCNGIKNMIFAEGLKVIEQQAFSYSENLTIVELPASLDSLGLRAFSPCTSLSEITIKSDNPEVYHFYNVPFYDIAYGAVMYYPNDEMLPSYWSYSGAQVTITTLKGRLFEKDGVRYNILEDNTVELVSAKAANVYSGDFVVPETVTYNGKTYHVERIGFKAFLDCTDLTSIKMHDNMTMMHDKAFAGCSSLKEVVFPSSIKHINSDAFNGCTSLTHVTIPSGLDYLGHSVFENCTGLISATAGSLSPYCFAGCKNLKHVMLDEGITSIPMWAIVWCESLTDINLPISLTSLESFSFSGCSSLERITIPANVSELGEHVFSNCTSLVEVTSEAVAPPTAATNTFMGIPDAALYVPEGSEDAYRNAIGWDVFKTINGKGLDNEYSLLNYKKLDDGVSVEVTTVPSGSSSYTGDIRIPPTTMLDGVEYNVTAIGEKAFRYSKITSITIPSSIKAIGEEAFFECEALTKIVVEGATPATIGADAFREISTKAILYVPDGARDAYVSLDVWNSIPVIAEPNSILAYENLYYNRIGDEEVEVIFSIPDESEYAGDITIPATVNHNGDLCNVTAISNNAFYYCGELTRVVIPEGIESIGNEAFASCWSLEDVNIPSSVSNIGTNAFGMCSELSRVVIPDGIETIKEWTFGNCTRLREVSLPEGLKTIESGAFYNSGLTTIFIPASVQYIGTWAFSECNMHRMVMEGEVPPFVEETEYEPFDPSNVAYYLLVPKGCKEIYSATAPWGSFTDIRESASDFARDGFYYNVIDEAERKVEVTYPFINNSYELSDFHPSIVTIPQKVVRKDVVYDVVAIGDSTFYDSRSLSSITIPEGVVSIGEYSLSSCNYLKTVSLPTTLTSIGEGAFYWSQSITEIAIPDNVESVGAEAFFGCMGLTEVCLPVGVTSIEEGTFRQCESLAKVSIPSSVTYIANNAFLYSALKDVVIPASVTMIGERAFKCDELGKVVAEGTVPAEAVAIAFGDEYGAVPADAVLYVPAGSKKGYSEAVGWNRFTNIVELKTGDTNHDDVIDEADVENLAERVSVDVHCADATTPIADINSDGKTNVVDIVSLVNDVTTNRQNVQRKTRAADVVDVSVEALVMEANDTVEVAISLENTVPYAAFQMDIHLLKGLNIVSQSLVLGERATDSHRMKASSVRNNTLRVISYSVPSENLIGASGNLVKMNVVADDDFRGGELLVDNIVLATSAAEGYELSSVKAEIESTTEVADIIYDGEEPVEFYNLQGVKVDVPQKGIYIKRQGNVIKKVYYK